jgi:hypothetical protein
MNKKLVALVLAVAVIAGVTLGSLVGYRQSSQQSDCVIQTLLLFRLKRRKSRFLPRNLLPLLLQLPLKQMRITLNFPLQ